MAKKTARTVQEQRVLDLLRRYREAGDQSAREALIVSHTHLVDWVVKGFLTTDEPLEDLRQEGFIGLAKAVDSFDPARGVKFITYATHLIQGEIRHYLRDRKTLIRRPGWLHDLMQRVEKESAHLRQELGREPSLPELARELNLREDSLAEVLRVQDRFAVRSLDRGSDGNGDGSPDLDIDRRSITSSRYRTGQLPIEDRIALEEAVQRLKYLERQVIYYLFYRDFTHAEIAEKLDTSCSNVSRVAQNAIRKLRRIMLADELKESHLRVRTAPSRAATLPPAR